MNNKRNLNTFILLVVLLCAGCSALQPPPPTLTPSPTITPTLTRTPTPPHTPTATPSPIPTATLTRTPPPATLTLITPDYTPTIPPTLSTEIETTSLVLWDLSHGPRQSETGTLYEPGGLYSQLKFVLEKQNIILESNEANLSSLDLEQYAVIVIAMVSAQKQNFSTNEAEILAKYVDQGGSLLILAENPDFPNRIRAIAGYFGFDVGQEKVDKSVTHFADHLIFEGVDEIYVMYEGGSISVTNKAARILADQNGLPVVVSLLDLPGRLVIIGDCNMFDNRGLSRNLQFAKNLFEWLTNKN